MKGIEAVAHIYADALIQLAYQKGVPGEMLRDLEEVGRVLKDDRRALTFLVAPNIRKEAKRQVIDKAFGGRVSEAVQNFLKIAVDKDRAAQIPSIIQAFKDAYHERQGELLVHVESPYPLEEDERQSLKKSILDHHREAGVNDVVLEEKINPTLLGGLIIRTGDQLFDASLLSRLNHIGDKLKAIRMKHEGVVQN